MRIHRVLSILGLAVAVPMLVASMSFACEKSCSGNKASAATASAQTAGSKDDCAAKCAASAKTASASDCAGKVDAASAGAGCAGKATAAAAGAGCAGKADAASAGASCAGKATASAAGSCGSHEAKHASCGADCNMACCAGKTAATITYKVAGMTCMGCVKQVEAAVAKMELENVESVTVNLDDANAVVTTNGPVDAIAVADAITKAGFKAEFAGAEHPATAKAETEKKEEPAATM